MKPQFEGEEPGNVAVLTGGILSTWYHDLGSACQKGCGLDEELMMILKKRKKKDESSCKIYQRYRVFGDYLL